MAFNESNPTVTANVGVKSTTISSAPINAYCNFTMRQRGSLTDNLNVSTGVQRFTPGQTGATTIITAANVTADKNGYVYIKNLSTTVGEECIITLTNGSGQTCSMGNLAPGSATVFPYDGNCDVKITCAARGATQEIEFAHILEDTTY